jgi:hypothetical protein
MNLFYIAHPQPFWFVQSDLLAKLFSAEIAKVKVIRDRRTRLDRYLDSPEAKVSQRKLCFVVLAHGKVWQIAAESFAIRKEPSPRISEEDSSVLNWIAELGAGDAPAWVLDTKRVVNRLREHLLNALPHALRTGSYDMDDPVQMNAIESAKSTLNKLESLQSLIERVLDQQFSRVSQRWAQTVKKPNNRAGLETRLKLFAAIRKILKANRDLKGIEFCAALDRRHAPPLYDWVKKGGWSAGMTWKAAWKDRDLQRKIRRVRQDAFKNR